MEPVEIVPLTKDNIEEAAKIGWEAFKKEAFTSYLMNLSGVEARKRYLKSIELKLEVLLEAQQPVLTAVKGGKILGAVILKTPHNNLSLFRLARIVLPRLPGLLPLVFNLYLRRALGVRKAITPPQGLPKPYYTVEILAVTPQYQGQGIGKLLLEEACRLAAGDSGIKGIYLFTGSQDTKNLYEHLGYETVEVKEGGELKVYHLFRSIH